MREWVARLRSGDYRQGKGKLSYTTRRDGQREHCCLGVLSDIAVEHGVTASPVGIPEVISRRITNGEVVCEYATVYNYDDGNTTMPSQKVYEWSGIEIGCSISAGPDAPISANKLANMNDRGATFAEIADYIEEQWVDLPEGTEVPDSPATITAEETVNA